jgi:hypothetical protein
MSKWDEDEVQLLPAHAPGCDLRSSPHAMRVLGTDKPRDWPVWNPDPDSLKPSFQGQHCPGANYNGAGTAKPVAAVDHIKFAALQASVVLEIVFHFEKLRTRQ